MIRTNSGLETLSEDTSSNITKQTIIPLEHYFFFFPPGTRTPVGVVFYSPLAGFRLLAYEVS